MNRTRTIARHPWSSVDEQFFRIVATAFSPSFTAGSSALLASYDVDCDDTPTQDSSTATAFVPTRRASTVT
jgi:hypothetical protein